MLRRILPFVVVAITMSTLFSFLMTMQRRGLIQPTLERIKARVIEGIEAIDAVEAPGVPA